MLQSHNALQGFLRKLALEAVRSGDGTATVAVGEWVDGMVRLVLLCHDDADVSITLCEDDLLDVVSLCA